MRSMIQDDSSNLEKLSSSSSSCLSRRKIVILVMIAAACYIDGYVTGIHKILRSVLLDESSSTSSSTSTSTSTSSTTSSSWSPLCKVKSNGLEVESAIQKDLQTKQQMISETLTATTPPLQLLRTYMQQHSHATLLQEYEQQQQQPQQQDSNNNNSSTTNGNGHGGDLDLPRHRRRYVIAYYSCPQQAGNRLHQLFNALAWGIVLNRTVLVQYFTRQACLLTAPLHDPDICEVANQPSDCEQVLHRHDWIPLYQDWQEKLGLPSLSQRQQHTSILDEWNEQNEDQKWNETTTIPTITNVIVDLHYWSVRGPTQKEFWTSGNERYAKIDARLANTLVLDFPKLVSQNAGIVFTQLLREQGGMDHLLATPEARERARDLVALGSNYLYGMLFRHIFDYQPVVLPSKRLKFPKDTLLIAVHSRHEDPQNNGTDIHKEIACIDQVLLQLRGQQQQQKQKPVLHVPPQHDEELLEKDQDQTLRKKQLQLQSNEQQYYDDDAADSSSCVLILMSDRTETLRLLEAHAKTRNCTALTAPKSCNEDGTTTLTPSWREEHGPFSGMGFYEDLAFVITALAPRTIQAFVSKSFFRSSSQLYQEQIEYDRFNDMMLMEQQKQQQQQQQQQQKYTDNNISLPPLITCHYRNQ